MTTTIQAWPRLMRPDVAEGYLGGRATLERLAEFGLRPSRQAKSHTLYLKDDVDKAINEAHLAEWNPANHKPAPAKKK